MHIIAFDPGRVHLFHAVQYKRGADGTVSKKFTKLTAASYQRRALITRINAEEREYRQRHPELAAAYAKMSETPWKTTYHDRFVAACRTFAEIRTTLVAHHVELVDHAKRRMLTWRKKTSAMMQSFSDTIRECYSVRELVEKRVQIVMALGDGNVKPTGRRGAETSRHGAVPTTWKDKMMERVLRSMRGVSYKITSIDEHRTTKCCHKCGSVMQDHRENGTVVRGLKRCTVCADNGSFKLRNRDGNAAQNIWKIAYETEHGRERPDFLRRQPPKRRARVRIATR